MNTHDRSVSPHIQSQSYLSLASISAGSSVLFFSASWPVLTSSFFLELGEEHLCVESSLTWRPWMSSCCWFHDCCPALTHTGVGPGAGAKMLWTGLLDFHRPPLSREWLFSLPCTGVPLWSRPSCGMYPPTPPMPPPPLPAEPWDEWLNQRQRSLRICFTSNSFFPDTDILLWVWKRGLWCIESPKTWGWEEWRALVSVSTVYSEPLLFRYFLTNSMTTPSSLLRCSFSGDETRSSAAFVPVTETLTLPPSLPHCFSFSLSFPPAPLLLLSAAAAGTELMHMHDPHTRPITSPVCFPSPPSPPTQSLALSLMVYLHTNTQIKRDRTGENKWR